MNKIFGIGLSRTGTTSLTKALQEVGINIIHYPLEYQLYNPYNDGGCDISVAANFEKLDQKFPNSKFIYTIRDKQDWLIAMEGYLKQKENRPCVGFFAQNRKLVYSQINFDREIFSVKYDEHDQRVKNYFKNRDLLILNICKGEDLSKLYSFIGVKNNTNIKEFPHENSSEIYKKRDKIT